MSSALNLIQYLYSELTSGGLAHFITMASDLGQWDERQTPEGFFFFLIFKKVFSTSIQGSKFGIKIITEWK